MSVDEVTAYENGHAAKGLFTEMNIFCHLEMLFRDSFKQVQLSDKVQ